MRCLIAVLAVAAASNAYGEALIASTSLERPLPVPVLRIHRPSNKATVPHAELRMWVQEHRTLATLTLDIKGNDSPGRDVMILLDVPAGTQATGLSIEIAGQRTRATPLPAIEAAQRYQDIVERKTDPGLLEATPSGLRLRVFPIEKGIGGQAEITLILPPASRLAIEPVDHKIAELAVAITAEGLDTKQQVSLAKRHVLELPTVRPGVFAATPAPTGLIVDDKTSLFAGWFEQAPTIVVGGGRHHAYSRRSIDKAIIRKQFKLHQNQIRYCFERELLRDPKLSGAVVVSMTIQPDGAVTVNELTGSLADPVVRACIGNVVSTFKYPAHDDGRIVVNYPLRFCLAGS